MRILALLTRFALSGCLGTLDFGLTAKSAGWESLLGTWGYKWGGRTATFLTL